MTKLALRDIDLDDPSAGRRSTPHAFCAANDNHRPWWSRAQASGRPAQRLRGDGQTSTYHYDAEFGITSEAEPNGTVSYGYDAYGRRQTLTYPNGMVVTYGYDNANRMKTIATGGVTLGTYSYDPFRLTGLTRGNGIPVTVHLIDMLLFFEPCAVDTGRWIYPSAWRKRQRDYRSLTIESQHQPPLLAQTGQSDAELQL